MSIPHHFDPMGTAGGGLPPGYERVESILKPDGAYWKTDIPVITGMRMEADIMVTALSGGSSAYFDFLCVVLRSVRLNYLWGAARDKAGTSGKRNIAFTRYNGNTDSDIGYTDMATPINQRETFIVSHYSSYTDFTMKNSGQHELIEWLTPLALKDDKGNTYTYDLGHYVGSSLARGAIRIYDLAMYEEGTNKLLFHFVPFRKMVNAVYSYGLYDVVNKKELPVVAGKISA